MTPAAALRAGKDRAPFLSDGGHCICDCAQGRIAGPAGLDRARKATPGAVGSGRFIGPAERAIFAGPAGVETARGKPRPAPFKSSPVMGSSAPPRAVFSAAAEISRPMPQTRYDELKAAIRAYGAAAFQNLLRSKALGEAVIEGLASFLGCAPENVAAVPAEGPFDPREDYGERAFSFHGREVIILEPVRFGLSLVVGNVEDSGALWLRTQVAAEVAGDHFDVYVGSQPVVRTPLDFADALGPVFEAVHREFLDAFELEVLEFEDLGFKTGIGFLPARRT